MHELRAGQIRLGLHGAVCVEEGELGQAGDAAGATAVIRENEMGAGVAHAVEVAVVAARLQGDLACVTRNRRHGSRGSGLRNSSRNRCTCSQGTEQKQAGENARRSHA